YFTPSVLAMSRAWSSVNSRIEYEATPIFSGPPRTASVASGFSRTAADSAPGTRLSTGQAAAAAAAPKKRRRERLVIIEGLLGGESYSRRKKSGTSSSASVLRCCLTPCLANEESPWLTKETSRTASHGANSPPAWERRRLASP